TKRTSKNSPSLLSRKMMKRSVPPMQRADPNKPTYPRSYGEYDSTRRISATRKLASKVPNQYKGAPTSNPASSSVPSTLNSVTSRPKSENAKRPWFLEDLAFFFGAVVFAAVPFADVAFAVGAGAS